MPSLSIKARERDLDTLTSIYRLRKGKSPSRLEGCIAVLATTSGGLCKVARNEFKGDSKESIPLVLPDHHLQTIAWLKHPLKKPDLPKQVVIAHCYSAIRPNDLLWSRYLNKVRGLGEGGAYKRNYLWLKYSRDARQALMDQTLGVTSSFSEETLTHILDERYKAIRQPLEDKLNEYEETLTEQQKDLRSLEAQVDSKLGLQSRLGKQTSASERRGWKPSDSLKSLSAESPNRIGPLLQWFLSLLTRLHRSWGPTLMLSQRLNVSFVL